MKVNDYEKFASMVQTSFAQRSDSTLCSTITFQSFANGIKGKL